MPLSESLDPVITELLKAAKQNRVNWRESGGTFSVVFPNSSISIWYYFHDDETEETSDNHPLGITVQMLNSEGKVAARDYVKNGEYKWNELTQILDLANRKHRGLDEAINDALKNLTKPDGSVGLPPPKEPDIPF